MELLSIGQPQTVQELLDLVSKHKPNFVFLMELKSSKIKVDKIKNKLGFEGIFVVLGRNSGGDIALIWREKHMAKLLAYSSKFIYVMVSTHELVDWRPTVFYGYPERSREDILGIYYVLFLIALSFLGVALATSMIYYLNLKSMAVFFIQCPLLVGFRKPWKIAT